MDRPLTVALLDSERDLEGKELEELEPSPSNDLLLALFFTNTFVASACGSLDEAPGSDLKLSLVVLFEISAFEDVFCR